MARKKSGAKKQPKTGRRPTVRKKPKLPPPKQGAFRGNFWHFSEGDTEGSWPLGDIDNAPINLRETLASFEKLNESEMGRGQCHHVEVTDLCQEAQTRLGALRKDDLTELYSMRLDGKKRLWARRLREEVQGGYCFLFYLLWWDPCHQVCPSRKKHS
jgi:hypothetical protein